MAALEQLFESNFGSKLAHTFCDYVSGARTVHEVEAAQQNTVEGMRIADKVLPQRQKMLNKSRTTQGKMELFDQQASSSQTRRCGRGATSAPLHQESCAELLDFVV